MNVGAEPVVKPSANLSAKDVTDQPDQLGHHHLVQNQLGPRVTLNQTLDQTVDPKAQASYHFVGIGGVGMSALAHIYAKLGHRVSGSDRSQNAWTQRLQALGVTIYEGHDAAHVAGDPCVVYSSAIRSENPELKAALDRGLAVCHRSALLAQLFLQIKGIGVAGTHGKTTTSSMIGFLLLQTGWDPTLVIGGEVDAWGGNARLGAGEYLVAEVDESDGSLVQLQPQIGIITNIELDHPDHFADLEQVIAVFRAYARQCQLTIGSLDCVNVAEQIRPSLGYSLHNHPEAAYLAQSIRYGSTGTEATIWEKGICLGSLRLKVLGAHNLSNALAAVATGRHLGIPFEQIATVLGDFVGAHRRFELKGMVQDVVFIDDYAHHPSEIEATLSAAQLQQRRVVAVFQPHRYSRLASLFEDFAQAFSQADLVVITPTYSAGEGIHPNTSSLSLAAEMAQCHPWVCYEPSLDHLPQSLSARLQPGDLVLFLGAGDLNRQIPATIEAYTQRCQVHSMPITAPIPAVVSQP